MGRITAAEIDVSHLLTKNSFYIPSYQRGYSWDEETSGQLIDDLFEHLRTKPEADYYVGNIVVYQERDGFKNKLVVVDGQQRITTFMLMITALRINAFTSPSISEEEYKKIDENLKKFIFDKNRETSEDRLKLFSTSRSETVKDIINTRLENKDLLKDKWAKDVNAKYSDTNYHKNLVAFMKKFDKELTDFYSYDDFVSLLERIIFVMIDISNDEGVHEIFENINSKGKDLSLMDLTKNLIFILLESYKKEKIKNDSLDGQDKIDFENEINVEEDEISKLFEDNIKSLGVENDVFITNYLIYLRKKHFNKTKVKEEVYPSLKKFIKNSIKEGKLEIGEFILELKEQVSLVKYIENFSSANSSNQYDLALFLNKEDLTSVLFPFVYAMAKKYDSFDNGVFIVNGQFEDFIILMDRFFSRRFITNQTTKNFNKYVPTILKRIDELEDYEISTLEKLLTKSDEDSNGSLMPNKNEVLKYFRDNLSPYKNKTSKQLKHILFRINYYMSINSKEGIALTDEEYKKFTIEHIMPQKPKTGSIWKSDNESRFMALSIEKQKEYNDLDDFYNSHVHNWGNLTITQDNSKLSNDDFEDKREIFESSVLKINNNISNNANWTLKEIEKRRVELAKVIEDNF